MKMNFNLPEFYSVKQLCLLIFTDIFYSYEIAGQGKQISHPPP